LPTDVFIAAVGPQAQIERIRRDIGYQKVADRVYFLGPLDDMAPAYRAADCLAHPTLEDTFAMVALEAMASGIPVVVSQKRYCGIAALLQNGQQALILDDPQDSQQLAGLLLRLLSDAALREHVQQAARAFAGTFLWCQLAARQEALYFEAAP